MKKGVLAWDKLVEAIPYIVVFIGLIALFMMLLYGWIGTPRSSSEQDFVRIVGELDELLAGKGQGSIDVPIQAESGLNIVIHPKGASPARCQGQACICLYETKENKLVEHCKMYKQISNVCATECGPICQTEVRRVSLMPGDTSVTVARGCNDISIT